MSKTKKKSKNTYCKVVVCCLEKNRATRTNCQWPDHNQDNDYQELLTDLLKNETEYDAGVPMDTFLVFNGGSDEWKRFDGTPTKNGTLFVVDRENVGGSFGGYDYVFENYTYDYYLLCEDDLFVFGDLYYKKILDRMNESGADFMALIGLCKNNRYPIHAHGGVGLVTRTALEKLKGENRHLPYPSGMWDRGRAILEGEIPFTNEMFKLGLKLDQYGTNEWNRNNLIFPYYDIRKPASR